MKTNPLFRTALNFGAMSGLASFLVFLALYFKGLNPLGTASWLGAWIPVVFLCIATKNYRDHALGGFINYGQGMRIGLLTALAASFLFALLIYIFVTIFDSNVIELYKNEMKAGLEETKFMFSDEMFDKAMEGFEKLTIVTVAYNDFFIKMVGGLLVTFITAAIYRRVPKPFEE